MLTGTLMTALVEFTLRFPLASFVSVARHFYNSLFLEGILSSISPASGCIIIEN